jgi:hypothetical protein
MMPKKQAGSITNKIFFSVANSIEGTELREKCFQCGNPDVNKQAATQHSPEITKFNLPFPERKHAFQAINHLFQVFRKRISNCW